MLCLCTNTSCQWKKMDLGALDNLLRFFKEEKIISAQVTEKRETLCFSSLL